MLLRLKNVLPSLISPSQTAYIKNRFISESGKIISEIRNKSEQLNIELLKLLSFLVTTDIQKPFDSVNHSFLLAILKAFGFGKNFLHQTEILLTNQESCVLNGCASTKYFN